MIEGKKIGAVCITEADAGSDATNMRTYARKDGDNYILNGRKMFVSNGTIADIFLVFAVSEKDSYKRFTAFIVDKNDCEGVKIGKDIPKMGLGGCPTCEVVFENCIVSRNNILGSLNNGYSIMMKVLEWERCFEFVPNIGTMKRIMENCIEYANTRKQFGNVIGKYQAVSSKISQMKIAIELSESMMYKIAWMKNNAKSAFLEASIFKYYVSNAYINTCKDAVQIFGGYGYSKENDYERELRDAMACSIYSGTNEMIMNTIYDTTLSLSLL